MFGRKARDCAAYQYDPCVPEKPSVDAYSLAQAIREVANGPQEWKPPTPLIFADAGSIKNVPEGYTLVEVESNSRQPVVSYPQGY